MAVKSLSVIIPCFRQPVELQACLGGLQSQQAGIPFEVIVVDSSPDPGVQEAVQRFPFARLIRSQDRLFAGAARNLGARNAAGDGLAFTDADCIPQPGWVQQACASLSAGYKMIGGPVLDVRPVRAIPWADNRLQFADYQAGRRAGAGAHFPSCNLVLPRLAFDKLGGFPEDLVTGEDAILSARAAREFSSAMWFNPGLIVRHHGRQTLRSFLEHQRTLGYHRGWLGLVRTPAWDFFARSSLLGGAAIMWRFGFVVLRTLQYDTRGLGRLSLYFPLLLLGLAAWVPGFYHGVHAHRMEKHR